MKKLSNKISTTILWLILAGALVLLIFTFTEANDILAAPLVRDESPQPADVIIILGGGVVTDLKILPWAVQERVQRGVELYKAGYADKVIVTGGLVKGHDYSESDFLAPYAEQLGVAYKDLFPENKAKDTYENAIFSHKIMQEYGWVRALMVTSDFHTGRACRVFKKQNIEVVCVAAYKKPSFKGYAFRNLNDFQAIVRDYLATAYYLIKGYI